MKRVNPVLIALLGALVFSACSVPGLNRPQPTPAIPIDLPLATQAQLGDFDLLTKALADQYIDPKAVGNDWQSSLKPLRDRIVNGVDDTTFFSVLDEALGTLRDQDLIMSRPSASPQPTATVPVTAAFSGVGMIAGLPEPNKDRILVLAVYPNSPAAKGGILAHDAIVQIDGKPVLYTDRDNLISKIRGPTGTQVVLTIRTPGKNQRDVTLTRAPITPVSAITSRRIAGTNIGYIAPDTTNMLTMRLEVSQAMRDLSTSQSIDGLVLDLRTAQSPDFPISDMLGLFANGQVGTLYDRTGKTKLDITGKDIAGSQELPLVIMVSDQTRGIAESFAGMLQDMGRAKVAGSQTPGRLAILIPLTLPNSNAAIAVPSGEYRGVKDKSWYKLGIKPDIASDQTWEQYTDDNDTQLQQAVQALTR